MENIIESKEMSKEEILAQLRSLTALLDKDERKAFKAEIFSTNYQYSAEYQDILIAIEKCANKHDINKQDLITNIRHSFGFKKKVSTGMREMSFLKSQCKAKDIKFKNTNKKADLMKLLKWTPEQAKKELANAFGSN